MRSSKWKIACASVIGTAHIARETECQDRYDFRVLKTTEGEVLVAALADGAGSSERSQIGAELACALFIEQVNIHFESEGKLENLTEDFGILWLDYFRQKITELATEEEKPAREFACTFLGAVVGEKSAVFYQVGDGAIVCSLSGESESYFFAVVPAKKTYANATDFITDENARKRLLYDSVAEPIEDLAMFTDGIQAVAVNYQSDMPHEPFLKPMLAPLRKAVAVDGEFNENLSKFLASPKINDKTDDDKTLFLASRHVPAAVEPTISKDATRQKMQGDEESVTDESTVVVEDKNIKSESETPVNLTTEYNHADESLETNTEKVIVNLQAGN